MTNDQELQAGAEAEKDKPFFIFRVVGVMNE
jgi:hypothetical protein